MAKTVADVLKLGKDVKMVDVRFIDMPGTWQHFTIPVHPRFSGNPRIGYAPPARSRNSFH